MIIVTIATIVAVLGGANYLFGPKVPLYQFQVLWPPLLYPTGWNELSTTLYAQIQLQNDNIVRTNIHAASFDLFFPGWNNQLVHIGHVQDMAQYQLNATSKDVVWSMPAKQLFSIQDTVRLRIPISSILSILSHLMYLAIIGGGTIPLPSTGVVHIKAAPLLTKITMAMVCDTTLNVIAMQMQGQACTMRHLTPGWLDMEDQVYMMQDYALRVLEWNSETLTVLGSSSSSSKSHTTTRPLVDANQKTKPSR